ncbi:MAG TPA: DNA-3-methyladenine glycosylase, partial [Clostridia bacterium]|nr:DNA-3-methyladenine glycosylase [Clostridia bacterium]
MKKLSRSFYQRNTLDVAKDLLNKIIVHQIKGKTLAGKIVEVEAYIGPEDKAAHSYNNLRTARNEVMYGPPGFAYIYLIYGMYYCLNVVTEEINKPAAVLIRALEPLTGIDEMAFNRYGKSAKNLNKRQLINLTNGPGKLCQAMEITKANYGQDLTGDTLYICEDSSASTPVIISTPRINIDYAEEAADYP